MLTSIFIFISDTGTKRKMYILMFIKKFAISNKKIHSKRAGPSYCQSPSLFHIFGKFNGISPIPSDIMGALLERDTGLKPSKIGC